MTTFKINHNKLIGRKAKRIVVQQLNLPREINLYSFRHLTPRRGKYDIGQWHVKPKN